MLRDGYKGNSIREENDNDIDIESKRTFIML